MKNIHQKQDQINSKGDNMHSVQLPQKSILRRRSQIKDFEPNQVDNEICKQQEIGHIVDRHFKTGQPFPTGAGNFIDNTTIPNDLQSRYALPGS